jgi:hypothetical protein
VSGDERDAAVKADAAALTDGRIVRADHDRRLDQPASWETFAPRPPHPHGPPAIMRVSRSFSSASSPALP